MRNLAFVIFVEIFAVTQASKSRSVNVALETVLEFDNKDDVNFIDTMQSFLRNLKTAIARNKATVDKDNKHLDNNNEEHNNPFVFTDFITDTVTVLKSYNNDDLKEFFRTLDNEINAWQTRKQLNEITAKLGFRRIVDRTLKNLRNSSVNEIRRRLNSLSDTLNFVNRNGNRGLVGSFLNYFYKKESESKLLRLLNKLKIYRSRVRRNNIDLKKVIRQCIFTVIEPLLGIDSDAINNINLIYHKYIANFSDPSYSDDYIEKDIKNKRKPKISRQKNKLRSAASGLKILDYIEDYKRIVDNRFIAKGFRKKDKTRPLRQAKKSTHKKNILTIKSEKNKESKTKKGTHAKITVNVPNTEKPKYTTLKLFKTSSTINDGKDRQPVIIKLGSDEQLKSVSEYLFATARQRLNKKQFKKSTIRKLVSIKRNIFLKTTKKSHKAFRPTTLSGEGLSIEHFGSLFGNEFHRKSNDNDTFSQTNMNSSVAALRSTVTLARDQSDDLSMETTKAQNLSREKEDYNTNNYHATRNWLDKSQEIRRNDNLSDGKADYNTENYNETKNVSRSKDNTQHAKIITGKDDLITEPIKINGNIVIETPTEKIPQNEIEITTSNSVNNFTTYRNINVSIVTKLLNVKHMKPTIILRSQDMENLNETYAYSRSVLSKVLQTTLTSPQTTNIRENTVTDKVNLKTLEDGLENEIEDIMDKHNATKIPDEFVKFLKDAEMNGDNKKVRDQMQADLAKLLAPPSTKSTVTEVFTDPFDDIDDGADIL